MKRTLCLFLLVSAITALIAPAANAQTASAAAAEQTASATLKWYTIDEVLGLASKNPKKIFIDVYTDWCGWCKVMDRQTFTDPRVAAYLTANFYPVKFNAEQKTDVVFDDKTYSFRPEYRANELAVALLQGKMSFPTTVYMNTTGQLLSVVPGFQKADGILPVLVFFAEDYYMKLSWEDFTRDVWPAKQKQLGLN
ncbi:MAG: DUF255 domain-containing protein [Prevotellaceae bacterium]|jgi:thioredoxin-related protein|nr:DUF255 domain-containing protein [Prevotellaceae bacterium]